MYLVLTASKDAYITNKILNNSYRAKDANTGRAGTLDLFKLYNESTLKPDSNPIEISRILLKFNFDTLADLTSSTLDVTDSSFKCELKLYNIVNAQAVPRNYNICAYPLSKSFDEGRGRDVSGFADLDVCNFVTASYSNGTAYPWNVTGAGAHGLMGSTNLDCMSSGSLGAGVVDFGATQHFDEGTEDLVLDVTKIVSATLTNQMSNHGFRISFSGSEETDTKTRFVKRFGSRHAMNIFIRPTMHVSFNDTIQDHHESFIFDVSGSIFLTNYHRGTKANILSGSSLTPLVGSDCMKVTIKTGSFSKSVNVSMHTGSTTGTGQTGIYSATFALPFSDQTVVGGGATVHNFAVDSGSLTFEEYWHSTDGTIGFYTGSLTIDAPNRIASSFVARNPMIKMTNMQSKYAHTDKVKFRLFGVDTYAQQNTPAKTARNIKSVIYDEVYYRVVDSDAKKIVIPFSKGNKATQCSTDSDGLFFDFHMNALFTNRVYHFEFLIVDRGSEFRLTDTSPRFRIVT
jgi:hypothetical protein